MSFRAYLTLMSWITLVAWGGWVFVLWNVDPEEAGLIGLFLFYLTLFASLVGTFAVGGAAYRVLVLKRREVLYREVRITFRHAIMVSLIGVLSLVLSAKALFHWWIFFLVLIVVGIFEYLFLLMQESRR